MQHFSPHVLTLLLAVIVCLIISTNAQISSFVSKNDIESATAQAKLILGSPKSVSDAYYAGKLLKAIDKKSISCNCGSLASLIASVKSPREVYYGLAAGQTCGCSGLSAPSELEATIRDNLQSQDLLSLTGAALASTVVKGVSVSWEEVVNKLRALMLPDGTFKGHRLSTNQAGVMVTGLSPIEHASIALETLSVGLSDEDKNDSTSTFGKVQKVLGEICDASMQLLPQGGDDGEETAVDPALLSFIHTIANKKQKAAIDKRVDVIADSLLNLRHSGDIRVLSLVLDSLAYIKSGTQKGPTLINVSLSPTTVGADDASKIINVKIVDLFGSSSTPEVEKIDVTGVSKVGMESVIFSGSIENGKIDLSSQSLTPGLYNAALAIKVKGREKAEIVTKPFSVVYKLDISDVRVAVNQDSKKAADSGTSVTKQNGLDLMTASATSGDVIHVAFSVSTPTKSVKRFVKPHQAFVKLTHIETGSSAFYVGSSDGQLDSSTSSLGSKYVVSVPLNEEAETFEHLSGDYTLSILVADAYVNAPYEWIVGSMSLTFPAKIVKDMPLYTRSLLHTSDNTLTALPEIVHQNRPPAKRANSLFATVFTALACAPLVAFLLFVLSTQPNIKRLRSFWSVAFVIMVAAFLLLYALYWLAVPLFSFYETIQYLCFMTPALLVVGGYALQDIRNARLSADKQT